MKSDQSPEICQRCSFRDVECAVRDQLNPLATTCRFSSKHKLRPVFRSEVSWMIDKTRRRFHVHYPNGSSVSGIVTVGPRPEEDKDR